MLYTRREMGKLALASLQAAYLLPNPATIFSVSSVPLC